MALPIVIFRGAAASGKTTLSHLVASKLKKSSLISQDDLRHMIIGGRIATQSTIHPPDDPDGYLKQSQLADENIGILSANYVKHGYIVIVDGLNAGESGNFFQVLEGSVPNEWFPTDEKMNEIFGLLKPKTVSLIVDEPELKNRLKIRGWSGDVLDFVITIHQNFKELVNQGNSDLIINTSNIDPSILADKIILELDLDQYLK